MLLLTTANASYGWGLSRIRSIQNTTRFNARAAVDSDQDSFTINNHGFQTGDTVVYNTDASFNTETVAYINRTFDPNGEIDITNDTITIGAQSLKTGDKVLYQSAYALDVNSAGNQAIGGLTSNTEYYLILVDDTTIKLAASEADALAGEAINLTSVGTGSSHTLVSTESETILVDDHEIHGLENTATYFVSVIDENTFRLTETRETAFDAEFVDLDSTNFGEDHRLKRADQDSPSGITISADLKVRDRSNGGGAARSTPKLRHFIKNPDLAGNARLDAKENINITSNVEYPFLFDVNDLAIIADSEEGDLTSGINPDDQTDDQLKLVELIGIDALFGGNLLLSKFTNTFAVTKNTGKIDKGQIKGASLGFNGTVAVNHYDNVSEAIIRGGAQINQNTDYQTDQQSVNVKADTDLILVGLVGQFHLDAAADVLATKTFRKGRNTTEFDLQSAFNPWGNTSQNGVGASIFAELLNNTTTAKIERGSQVHTGTLGDGLTVKAKEKAIVVGLTQSGAQVEGFGISGSGAGFSHKSKTIAQIESGTTIVGGPLTVNAHSDAIRVNAALTLVRSQNIGVGIGVAVDASDRQVRAIIGDDKDDANVIAAREGEAARPATERPQTSINVSGDIDIQAKVTGAVVSSALGLNTIQSTTKSGSSSSPSDGGGTTPTSGDGSGAPEGSGGSFFDDFIPSSSTFGHETPSSKIPENDTSKGFLDHLKKLAIGVTGGVAGNVQTEAAKAYIYDYHGNGTLHDE